jgi:hypothetical protein
MCCCFLKQLYLFLVTKSMVTQLLRVSPAIFLEHPLLTISFKVFVSCRVFTGQAAFACRTRQGYVIAFDEKKKTAFHLRALRYSFGPRSILGLNS